MVTDRQRAVLDNLDRLTSDGARYNARFELNGTCVSMQVRALLDKGMIVHNEDGRLSKALPPQQRLRVKPQRDVLADIRRALTG